MEHSVFSRITDKYPREERYTLAILQDIQKEYGFIPEEAAKHAAFYLNVPLNRIYGIATFYKALSLKPKGLSVVKVCVGTACHVRGAKAVLEQIEKELGIKAGETQADGRFSIDVVNCVGACALAPVVVIDDKYFGKVKPSDVKDILDAFGGGDCE